MVGMAVDLASLPYRCPRCEEHADFPTLEALRKHLATDHSYSRYSRSKAFKRNTSSQKDVSGRTSPLTESFLRQRRLLEEQLRHARSMESASQIKSLSYRHSDTDNHGNLHHGTARSNHYIGSLPGKTSSTGLKDSQLSGPMTSLLSHDVPVRDNDVTPQTVDSAAMEDQTLSVDDLKSAASRRAERRQRRRRDVTTKVTSHQDMADALDKARGHVDSMKQRADFVVQQQAALIELLRNELKVKDDRLDVAREQLSTLHSDRQRLLVKVSRLSRNQDQSADSIAQLTSRLTLHEQRIQDKEKEVAELSTLLQRESQEERTAKAHLEAYIHGLASRAERAETTLTSLGLSRSQPLNGERYGVSGLQRSDSTNTVVRVGSPEEDTSRRSQTAHSAAPTLHRSSQLTQQAEAPITVQQVNPYGRPMLSLSSSFIGSSIQYAPPTLSVDTPPFNTLDTPSSTPHVICSPHHTGSTSSEQSIYATSGYLSQTTGAPTHSSTPYINNGENTANGDTGLGMSLPLSQGLGLSTLSSHPFEGVMSPLSPGEVIVNQPHWFKPVQGEIAEDSRRGQEGKGAESELSDSQGSLSEHEAQGTLLYTAASTMLDKTQPLELNGRSVKHQQCKPRHTDSHTPQRHHRRVASWEPDSEHLENHSTMNMDKPSPTHSLPLSGKSIHLRHPPKKPESSRCMHEALTCVFRYLDTPALCGVSMVCREWREVSRQPVLWRKVSFQRAAISSRFLKTISRWCTELQSLTLDGLVGRTRRRNETPEEYKKAVRGSLEAGLEALLEAAGDSLLSLRVVDCGPVLTDRCLWLASCSSRFVQRVAYVSDSDPVGSEVIWALGAGCRHIQTLIIPPKYPNDHPHRYNDRCLTMTAACWPQLLVLCIGGIEITIKGLTALAKTCTRLQVLELDHVCEVTEDMAVSMCRHGLRGLRTLHFSSTPVTPRALLHFVSSCAGLETVRIHLSIADYFRDTEDVENQRHYDDVISKLQLVQNRPGMREIISINDLS